MAKQIKAETLREKAFNAIKNSILKNEFLPNQVVSINFLTEYLGISQTPIREALSRLSAEGLIVRESHKRLRIVEINETDINEVYEVRRLLESYAVDLVTRTISKNSKMRRSFQTLKEKAERVFRGLPEGTLYKEFRDIDLKLNDLLIQAIENGLFKEVLAFVSVRSLRIRTFVEASAYPPGAVIRAVTEEHLAIIQAILDQNTKAAQERVKQHLFNAERRTLERLVLERNPDRVRDCGDSTESR